MRSCNLYAVSSESRKQRKIKTWDGTIECENKDEPNEKLHNLMKDSQKT